MFHILGFIFFIILVVLLIGLFILSRVIGMIFGFKRRMQHNGSAQRTTYSSSSSQPQEDSFDAYSNEGNTSVRRRKKILTKKKENTWILKKSNKTFHLLFRKKSFISPAHSSDNTPFTTTVLGCKACGAYRW